MKISVLIVFISIINLTTYSQEVDYNLDNGYIAEGYDVVSYFMKSPKKGKNDFTYIYKYKVEVYKSIKFKFI